MRRGGQGAFEKDAVRGPFKERPPDTPQTFLDKGFEEDAINEDF